MIGGLLLWRYAIADPVSKRNLAACASGNFFTLCSRLYKFACDYKKSYSTQLKYQVDVAVVFEVSLKPHYIWMVECLHYRYLVEDLVEQIGRFETVFADHLGSIFLLSWLVDDGIHLAKTPLPKIIGLLKVVFIQNA